MLLRYCVHENGTDRQIDGQPENIMPLAMATAGVEASKEKNVEIVQELIVVTLNCHVLSTGTQRKKSLFFDFSAPHVHRHTHSQLDLSLFKFLQRLLSLTRRESGGELSSLNSTEELH